VSRACALIAALLLPACATDHLSIGGLEERDAAPSLDASTPLDASLRDGGPERDAREAAASRTLER
jgi:hypothetical protein